MAKAYTAACALDFFAFDGDRRLVYRSQLNSSRLSNSEPVTEKDLRGAIDAILADQFIAADQNPSLGCNIKWKAGNAPSYFG